MPKNSEISVNFLLRTFNSGGFLIFILWTDPILLRWNFAGITLHTPIADIAFQFSIIFFRGELRGNGSYNRN